MQPDQSRRPYPAFRAWMTRLATYSVVALAAWVAAAVILDRMLLHDLPTLAGWPAAFLAALALSRLAIYVVNTLLHDYREAAWRELLDRHEPDRSRHHREPPPLLPLLHAVIRKLERGRDGTA